MRVLMMPTESEFHPYANTYHTVLNGASAATAQEKDYFAHACAKHFAECLQWLNVTPTHVLDYGCGTGSSSVILAEALECPSLLGLDPSRHLISEARSRNGLTSMRSLRRNEFRPVQMMDAVYCSGTFHDIPPAERADALGFVYDSLRPGGAFGFWENNPWNPGTNYGISKCVVEEDSTAITSRHARRLLRSAGFDVLQTDFLFFFPRQLRCLRWIEPILEKVALGGQYQVLCRKPLVGRSRGVATESCPMRYREHRHHLKFP